MMIRELHFKDTHLFRNINPIVVKHPSERGGYVGAIEGVTKITIVFEITSVTSQKKFVFYGGVI